MSWLTQVATIIQQLLFCSFEVHNYDGTIFSIVRHKVKGLIKSGGIYVGSRQLGAVIGEEDERFIPSNGVLFFIFEWHVFMVTAKYNYRKGSIVRDLVISQLGWSDHALQAFVQTCTREYGELDKTCGKVSVYAVDRTFWELRGRSNRRPLSSVIYPHHLAQDIYDDVTRFLKSKQYYEDRFLPYQRTWLLHSEPGCGKTSLIYALASELGFSIYTLSLSNEILTDELLCKLLHRVSAKSIVILEDVDAAFPACHSTQENKIDEKQKRKMEQKLTFSGLLNALDGIGANNAESARLIFMTTNHLDRLDPALVRPGRVDRIYHIPLADRDQMRRLFLRFFPGESKLARAFSKQHPEGKWSMAALQCHLMTHRDDPQAAALSKQLLVQ